MRKITSPNAQNHAQLTVDVSTLKSVNVEIVMSKKQSKKHSSKQKDGNHSQEQKQSYMRKNGWAISHSNCPYCKSTETYISLYQDCRYCNKCDRTYDDLDVVRLTGENVGRINSEGNLSI